MTNRRIQALKELRSLRFRNLVVLDTRRRNDAMLENERTAKPCLFGSHNRALTNTKASGQQCQTVGFVRLRAEGATMRRHEIENNNKKDTKEKEKKKKKP